ncbi:hypothetical protein C8F01DRAFT_605353 [Mycena amicta]|nr:hypothetical protein C8F01DRAFT_605353 [Mycena amicta]
MTPTVDNVPDVPRRRGRSFYVVALFLLPLRAVAPLAWTFVIYSLLWGNVSSSKFFLAACEALFYLYYCYLSQLASRPWKHGTGNLAQLQIAYTRVLKAGLANLPEDGSEAHRPGSPTQTITQLKPDDPRSIDFRNMLRTWFGRVPFSQIRRLEVKRWIYWSIFNKDLPDTISPSHQDVLDDALRLLEMRLGTKVTEGSNPKILPMRLTLDKVQISARPFFLYVLIFSVNWVLGKWYAWRHQLCHGTHNGLEYLLYVPEDWDIQTGPRPTVFLHGLGFGLLGYHPMLMDLRHHFRDRPLLVPLQPHISQNIFHPKFLDPLCRQDLADQISGLMHKLGWVDLSSSDEDLSREAGLARANRGVTMLSHSNGSYLHAWCLKGYPELISRSCFADPAALCLWEGDLCYNFLYRTPVTGMELVMRYIVGTELGTAALLFRNFDWSANSLWYEDIPDARDPSKAFFLLGGNDAIVNAARVKRYLTSHGVQKGLWYDPHGQHGDSIARGSKGHTLVLEWLRDRRILDRAQCVFNCNAST